MKKAALFLIGFTILILLLFLVFLFAAPPAPVFSAPSGFYQESFSLSISSMGSLETVHYTLDGSIPTLGSPIYNEPLEIRDRSNDPNGISSISTISFRPADPKENVFKITTIRARSFNKITKAASPIVTQSYFVYTDITNRYTLPILSLVVDPQDLFDQDTGIYVTGEDPGVVAESGDYFYFWPANYHERGEDWERTVSIEYFDIKGILQLAQNAGIRIHGGASRSFRQKSLRLYASTKYDQLDNFSYQFFPNLSNADGDTIDQFSTLILRNGGTDFGSSFMRDALIQKLVEDTSVDTQAREPVIVFLNGEYWGLYYLYERYDEGYFQNHYGIEPENIILLEDEGDVVVGAEKERGVYQDLLEYVTSNDVKDPVVYSEIQKLMDINNFIDYQTTEIFIAHQDWPAKNIKYWRTRTSSESAETSYGSDGKWRWLLFDTDHGFIFSDLNSIEYATREDLPTELLRNLLLNPEFRDLFLNRFADHLNTTFQVNRVLEEIDSLEAILAPEMEEQINRWHSSGNSMEDWQNNVNLLRSFAAKRPSIVFEDLVEFFNLDGTFTLTLTSDATEGTLQVNSLKVSSSTPGIEDPESFQGEYFLGVPVVLEAIPADGYLFSHWEGKGFEGETQPMIEIDPMDDVQLRAVFIPAE